MSELPVTESELVEILDVFGKHTEGKGMGNFVNDQKYLLATQAMLLKAQQITGAGAQQLPHLLQLVAWGAYMAEKGETRLMEVLQ